MSNPSDFIIENGVLKKYVGPGGNVVIPEGVTRISFGAFDSCGALTGVAIPEGVTMISDYAFSNCKNLAEVLLPKSVLRIGNEVFKGCKRLRLTIPSEDTRFSLRTFWACSGVLITPHWSDELGEAVKGCDDLWIRTENVPSEIPVSFRRRALLGFVSDFETDTESAWAKSWREYAQKNAGKLCNLAVEHRELLLFLCENALIKAKDIDAYMEEAEKCGDTEKKALLLNYQNKLGQEAVGQVRARKEKVKEDIAGAFAERSVARDPLKGIEGMTFVITGNLSRIWGSRKEVQEHLALYGASLDPSVTRKTDYLVTNDTDSGSEKNRKAAELGITVITEEDFNELVGKHFKNAAQITIPPWMKSIPENAFYNCFALTQIMIPSGVTRIGRAAFYNCMKLTEAALPEELTSLEDYAFYGCEALKTMLVPGGVTRIGAYAFSGCEELTSVTISEGTTSIGPEAFSGCIELKSIHIPESVASIERNAFLWCSSVTIRAPGGSYAEQYAKKKKIRFSAE